MTNLAICRLCLTDRDPSFIEVKQHDELINKIYNFASIEALPYSIDSIILCPDCRLLLTQFEQFCEGCIHNDQIFRERLVNEIQLDSKDHKMHENMKDDKVQQFVIIEEAAQQTIKEEVSVPLNENVRQTRNRQIKATNTNNVVKKECKPETDTKPDKDAIVEPPKPEKNAIVEPTKANKNTTVGPTKANKNTSAGPTKPKRRFVPETSNRYLPCEQCGKMVRRSNMRTHLETHDPKPPQLFCSHCGKKFRNPHLLKVHINSNHTFEVKYECEDCGKVYYRPNSLREHIYANHSEERRYECNVCGMKFSNLSKKTYHYIKQHTVAERYKCDYCDKGFKMRSDWTLHVRTHTGEKPFSCDICGKRFNKSYNVVIHKKSHKNAEARKIKNEIKTTA